jgi:hypothetical protein
MSGPQLGAPGFERLGQAFTSMCGTGGP